MNLAPICLFTYNRLKETAKTVAALQKNYLAPECELYIFADGSKNIEDQVKVTEVRNYLKTIQGFKKVQIKNSEKNRGLATSVIEGVTEILQSYDNVIVLEDDLVTSPNFLNFMNTALDFFEENEKIHSITGFTMNLPSLVSYSKDFYLGYRASSWGWGTWRNRWNDVDWEIADYPRLKYNLKFNLQFRRGGSDMPGMLRDQITGKIDSWAIRWCYHQFKQDMMTVFPSKSKVKNIGFNKNATHTKKTSRFHTSLESGGQREFTFDESLELDKRLLKEFRNKFSIMNRLKGKFMNIVAS